MKKSRNLLILLVVSMFVATLVGCGGESKSPSGDASVQTSGSDEGIHVNLLMASRDEYMSIIEREAKAIAVDYGVTITVQDAANDTAKQLQFVETARNNGDEVIVVILVDPATAAEVVEKAGDMKVIFVNRYPLDDSIIKDNVVYVGSDETEAGHQQADELTKYFNEKGQTEIKYVMIQGILGQDSVIKRSESVLEGLEKSGIKATEATAPIACEWDRAKALDKFAPMLSSGLEFDCIISNNDAMAIGAIEALEAAGIDPGTIPIVGVDATPDGIQAVKEGKMLMSALQNAKGQGKGIIMAVVNLMEGKPINEGTDYQLDAGNENVVWIPFESVNQENIDQYANYYNN